MLAGGAIALLVLVASPAAVLADHDDRTAAASTATTMATSPATSPAPATTRGWSRATIVGRFTEAGRPALDGLTDFAPIAISADGRGTVAYESTGTTYAAYVRSFAANGTPGPATRLRRLGTNHVAVDGTGHVLLSGEDGSLERTSRWIATETPSGQWSQTSVTPDISAAFGLASGFTVLSQLADTKHPNALPLASRTIATNGQLATTASALDPSVVLDDAPYENSGDGSNVAVADDGRIVANAWRVAPGTHDTVAAGYDATPALAFLGASPSVVDLTGDASFGAGAVDVSGDRVVVAGLHEQLSGDAGERGVPEYSVGTASGMTRLRRIPGVPARRAVEVDVAARTDGGAVVTWIQKPDVAGFSRHGSPRWAEIGPDGAIQSTGTFSATTAAAHVRVKRVGSTIVAVWDAGYGARAKVGSARLDGGVVTALRAPGARPFDAVDPVATGRLVAAGNHAAFVYPSPADNSYRLSVLTID